MQRNSICPIEHSHKKYIPQFINPSCSQSFVVCQQQQLRPYWVATNSFLGLAPFAFCFARLLDGETQIWLGDLRVAFCLVVFVSCSGLRIYHATCDHLCLRTASSHARTDLVNALQTHCRKTTYCNETLEQVMIDVNQSTQLGDLAGRRSSHWRPSP